MTRKAAAIAVLLALSTWPALAASRTQHQPILYRTIQQRSPGWLAFLPDNHTLLCGHENGTVSEFDIRTGKMPIQLSFAMNGIRHFVSGPWVYAVSHQGMCNGMVEGINAQTLERQRSYNFRAKHPGSLWVSKDGTRAIIEAEPGAGRSRYVDLLQHNRILAYLPTLPAGAAFSPNLHEVAYRRGRSIIVANTFTGARRRRIALRNTNGSALHIAFSPSGRTIAVTSAYGFHTRQGVAGFTYEIASGTRRWIHAENGQTQQLAWSPTGRWLLLSARNTDLAQLVNPRTSNEVAGYTASPAGTTDPVRGIAFSRNNRWMALCSPDGEIEVYQLPG